MNEPWRERLLPLLDTLLDRAAPRAALEPAVTALHPLLLAASGAPAEPLPDGPRGTLLESGLALGSGDAGRCVADPLRTARYLQGVAAALERRLAAHPAAPAHLLYAGSGPFGALALPLAARYGSDRLRLTLLEVDEESYRAVGRLIERWGIGDRIAALHHCDATRYRHPAGDPFHLLLSETMQRALISEPQVAIALNLVPQLAPGGELVPERIAVGAALAFPRHEFAVGERDRSRRRPLGPIFELNRASADPAALFTGPDGLPALPAAVVALPERIERDEVLLLTTVIHLGDGILLDEYDSGLTEPMIHPWPLRPGSRLRFRYALGRFPELLAEVEAGGSAAERRDGHG